MEGPALDGLAGFLAGLSWLSFVQLFPRWLWARRVSRKVMRGWLGAEPAAQGSSNLFRVLDHVAAERAVQLMDDAGHEEALQEFDWLVLRALLEDLRRPGIGRILPGRRRRTARPVVFVELPPPGEPGARAAERFLRALVRARATAGPPGPLVVAVGVPSQALLRDLGNPQESTFPEGSVRLADDVTPRRARGPGRHLRGRSRRAWRARPARRDTPPPSSPWSGNAEGVHCMTRG